MRVRAMPNCMQEFRKCAATSGAALIWITYFISQMEFIILYIYTKVFPPCGEKHSSCLLGVDLFFERLPTRRLTRERKGRVQAFINKIWRQGMRGMPWASNLSKQPRRRLMSPEKRVVCGTYGSCDWCSTPRSGGRTPPPIPEEVHCRCSRRNSMAWLIWKQNNSN